MRFTISRDVLLKPLQIVGGVVEKLQTLPILANILVKVSANKLIMTGTDLEVELVATADLQQAIEGEITLPGRKFSDICRALPEHSMVEVTVDGDKATLKAGNESLYPRDTACRGFPPY